jgi:hypothetical protein
MTEKEALEYLILFDATWHVSIAVSVYSVVRSVFLWLYRWKSEDAAEITRLNQECFILREMLENVTVESDRLEEFRNSSKSFLTAKPS